MSKIVHPPLRGACHLAIGLVISALVLHTWFVMGLIVPIAVSGNSMEPTLRGPFSVNRCRDCRHEFTLGVDLEPQEGAAQCPACGARSAGPIQIFVHAGQRMLVDRTAFSFRDPQRWEVVVFRCPNSADELCVKRIVGLPGETVTLAGGEVRINGDLVRPPPGIDYAVRRGDRPQRVDDRDVASIPWPDPIGPGRAASWQLGPDEYFVIGDNAAISDDSRNWVPKSGIDAKLLMGKPLGVR